MNIIGNFLGLILKVIFEFVNHYGISIILFTILVKIILLPLTIKQTKSTKAMQDIQPRIKEIQEKYKNKPEKQNEEIVKLYGEAKINPLSGCLPLLIQFPILIGLFSVLREPVAHGVFANKAAFLAADNGFLWIKSLTSPDYVLAVFSGASAYVMQKVMTPKDQLQGSMKVMTYVMAGMSFYWGFIFPAGLTLYWTVSNLFSIAQYYLIMNPLKAKLVANSKEEKLMRKSLKLIKSKSKEEAISKAIAELNLKAEDIEVEILENPSKGFLGFIGAKDGTYEIFVIEREVDVAKNFIEVMLKNANVDAKVNVSQKDNLIMVDIEGKEAASLIGRRGETLDSIQFLTGLALNKINKDSHTRVLVDIENYRSKREESLIRYANKVAREVAKTRKTKKLDYMNPYERRIIHSALQNDKYVITYSEGTDPYRRLVIECKR